MGISLFLAQFWGWFSIIVGLVFLLRKKMLLDKVIGLLEDKSLLLSFGFLGLTMGLISVILHNIWVADWRVAITILGWASLIKGIVLIGLPEFYQNLAVLFKNKPRLSVLVAFELIILIFVGAWLVWVSY